ncbi:MAG: C69 family dipeptidase [Candidatus Lokiarchaeota archaeon]|nr:C69 family dipeptidase [Candidatus Lokiarchaeota archaeon]
MCDTYVALGNCTIFGKNSDRLGAEAQLITHAPKMRYSKGDVLECTHISIPQVSETASVLLSQPYWMWGSEIGANEYSVAIGNEAVATKEPLSETGLLGMDLLRLGLERGKSAKEALDIIIKLLETHGQGGAHNKKGLNYHNSMIIADPKEAYVLETAGKWWIVEIVEDFRSISNNISIRGKGDMRKEGIIQHAIEQNYCNDEDDFDFKMIFSPSQLPDVFPLDSRDGCSLNQLANNSGKITPEMMMNFLRTHDPVRICMHQRNDQSTSSQVSELKQGNLHSVHWLTGSTMPCLSIFKPHVFPIEENEIIEAKKYPEINPNWFWAKHSEFIAPFKKKPNVENLEREKYYNKLRKIENGLINEVKQLEHQEMSISSEEYLKRMRTINKSAWEKSFSAIDT